MSTRTAYPSVSAPGHGGAETSIRTLADAMAARGHRTTYLSRDGAPWRPGLALATNTRTPSGVQLRQVRRMPGVPSGGTLDRWILDRALRREATTGRVDVAYCFYELDIVRALLRVRERIGWPKVVLRMAGMTWAYNVDRHPERAQAYERAFSEVDSVNFLHASLATQVDEGLRERGMRVAFRHTFVADVGAPAPCAAQARPTTAPFRIAMAARFARHAKRQDLLIEAAALLGDRVPLELLLVGSGARRDAMQALADGLGVGDRVRFVPALPQEQLWDLLSDVDLLCHASDSEGLGKIVVEALRMGLPVLASDVPALNGYLRDGDTGFLVANEPAAWAERIAELRADPERRRAVAERGKAYADAHFDPMANVGAYEEAFRVVVGG
jgi:glycosyltransferase involved in cell wall biosynthesis